MIDNRKMDFDVVRDLAATLPGVEDGTIHGAPSLRVRGRLLACPALHGSAEPNTLAVRIGPDQRTMLVANDPRVYYLTDHYLNDPTVLVRLSQISNDSLRDLLAIAWAFVSARTKERGKRPIGKRSRPPSA